MEEQGPAAVSPISSGFPELAPETEHLEFQAEEGQLFLEGQQPLLDLLLHQSLQLGLVLDHVDVVDDALFGSLSDDVSPYWRAYRRQGCRQAGPRTH